MEIELSALLLMGQIEELALACGQNRASCYSVEFIHQNCRHVPEAEGGPWALGASFLFPSLTSPIGPQSEKVREVRGILRRAENMCPVLIPPWE